MPVCEHLEIVDFPVCVVVVGRIGNHGRTIRRYGTTSLCEYRVFTGKGTADVDVKSDDLRTESCGRIATACRIPGAGFTPCGWIWRTRDTNVTRHRASSKVPQCNSIRVPQHSIDPSTLRRKPRPKAVALRFSRYTADSVLSSSGCNSAVGDITNSGRDGAGLIGGHRGGLIAVVYTDVEGITIICREVDLLDDVYFALLWPYLTLREQRGPDGAPERYMVCIKNQQTANVHEFVRFQVDRVTSKRRVSCAIRRVVDFDDYPSTRIDITQIRCLSGGLRKEVHVPEIVKINGTFIKFEPVEELFSGEVLRKRVSCRFC